MENAAYIGLSRQMTLRRELDIVANNIANASTTSFKVEQLLLGSEEGTRARNHAVPSPVNFVMDRGVGRDFSQGPIAQTGRTLDFAIEGEGVFFRLEGANGDRFTRDGAFTTDGEGRLTTEGGLAVLDAGGAEIILDPARGSPQVSPDGVISQEGLQVGRLGVVRFDDLSVLSKDGDGHYSNISNVEPADAPDARVRQGMLEGANVNTILEITNLIEISRAYERIAKMIDQNNELSKRAVERLGRAQ